MPPYVAGDDEYQIIVTGVKDTGLCGGYWGKVEGGRRRSKPPETLQMGKRWAVMLNTLFTIMTNCNRCTILNWKESVFMLIIVYSATARGAAVWAA